MQRNSVKYLHLRPAGSLPALEGLRVFRAVVIIEADVPQLWQWEVSRWLVASGCRYMHAWGKECGSWSEAVDEASLEAVDYEDMPEDQIVLTTSHDDEELSDVFWFSKSRARHSFHDLRETLILHISEEERREELEELYESA